MSHIEHDAVNKHFGVELADAAVDQPDEPTSAEVRAIG